MKTTALRNIAPRSTVEDVESGSPSREAIADRAYEIYMQRPAHQGSALDDWLRAERELTQPQEAIGLMRRRGIRRVIGPDLTSK